jgi:Kef-type K+ transport system membrane component KefB
MFQFQQWGYYDELLTNLPKWIDNGIERVQIQNGKGGLFLRDRYKALDIVSASPIARFQEYVLGLQQISEIVKRRLTENFVESGGSVKVVREMDHENPAGWIDHVKQDVGELVKQIENSGGDVFSKLHKAGVAHLETVLRLPSDEDENQQTKDEMHGNVTGHSPGIIIDPYNNRFVLSRPANLAAVGEDSRFLLELVMLLVSASLLGIICDRLRLPSFLGYLLAGMCLGPTCLDQIHNVMQLNTIGQYSLLFVVLSMGLECSLDRIKSGWKVAVFGVTGITLVGLGVSTLFGMYILRISLQQSLFIGLILSLSSTVIAVQCLQSWDSSPMNTTIGRTVLGILILQDLLFCVALAALPVLSTGGAGLMWAMTIFAIKTSIYTAILLIFCKLASIVYPRLLSSQSSLLSLVMGAALVGYHFGISMELGVFIAAMSVATVGTVTSAETCHQMELLSGYSSIFFFASVGLLVDMRFLWGEKLVLLPLAISVVILKAFAITVIMRIFRLNWSAALTIGVDLAQVSELALMLGARGRRLAIITGESYYILAGITALSMILSPVLWRFIPLMKRNGAPPRELPT